jgi:tetratricopeptide (TPR) repeat protein
MLRSVWKAEQLPDGLAAQIHARTGGNALFNEEVARGLLDDGTVRVDDGRAVLTGEVTTLHLPDSVHAVIRARIDRLDPDAREVLRLASVIGREFTLPLLEKLHPAPHRLAPALDALTQQDLIHPLRVVPEPAYLFKNALVQDVVYETLLLSQRKELHEQVGAAIEAIYADRIEQQYEALAGHYAKSMNQGKAVFYFEKAGDNSAKKSAVATAIRSYVEAIRRFPDLSDSPESDRIYIDLCVKLAFLAVTSPFPDLFKFLGVAAEKAKRLDDSRRLANVLCNLGNAQWVIGNIRDGFQTLKESITLAERSGDTYVQARAHQGAGHVSMYFGMYDEGIRHIETALGLFDGIGNDLGRSYSRCLLGHLFGLKGSYRKSVSLLHEGGDIARAISSKFREAWAEFWLGLVHGYHGDWQRSLQHHVDGRSLFQAIGVPLGEGWCRLGEGISLCWLGKVGTGIEIAEEGKNRVTSLGSRTALSFYFGLVAEVHAWLGDLRNCEECLESARKLEREAGEVWGLPWCERAMAIAFAGQANPEWNRVREHIVRCADELSRRAQRPDVATTHFRHAEILHKKGDLPAALQQLSQAEKLFHEMEMTWWSEQALALRGRIERGEKFVWFAPYADGPPKV